MYLAPQRHLLTVVGGPSSQEAAAASEHAPAPFRLLVFEDSIYWQQGQQAYTDQSFIWFALHLRSRFDDVEVLGRLYPVPGRSHYPLPAGVRLVPLPHYASLAQLSALPALVRSARAAWAALGRADVVWLLGPHPIALLMALLAPLRGTRVVLGVRQDLPAYARHRHPGRRWTHRAADLLEAAWRRLGRRYAVVAVGPELARSYAAAPRALELGVSLVPAQQLAGTPPRRAYDGPLQVVSVGRLEAEKNPLLLAEVLALLRAEDPRWRLVVCGDGPMRPELQARLDVLGLSEHAELRGYVPVDDGLRDVYLASHAFLHVSWTEGVPQVLFEAWAAGLPVVATDVGGVRVTAGAAALLLPPGDARAAAEALQRVASDEPLRARLVHAGRARAEDNTMEAALTRLGDLLEGECRCAG